LLAINPDNSQHSRPDSLGTEPALTSTTESRDSADLLRDTSAPSHAEIDTMRRRSGLIIPVAGIRPEELVDTYTAARSQGRTHNAIDIMAGKGTPVLAAIDGPIKRLFLSDKGGITLYQLGPDSTTVYYYAHLDAYAPGIVQGKMLKQGEVLGYVGDSGNAGAGNYHLHFAVWRITDPKNFWTGEDLNPYLLLRH
jgi:peptidoglycan LD-endopeptidase LytH